MTYAGNAAITMPLNIAVVARAGSGVMTNRVQAIPSQMRNVSPAGQAVAIQNSDPRPAVTNPRKTAIAAIEMSIGVVIFAGSDGRVRGASVNSADRVSK